MFWIGIIVGVIVGAVGVAALMALIAIKATNLSMDEISEFGWLMVDAGNNRASTVSVWHDGMLLNAIELEEK